MSRVFPTPPKISENKLRNQLSYLIRKSLNVNRFHTEEIAPNLVEGLDGSLAKSRTQKVILEVEPKGFPRGQHLPILVESLLAPTEVPNPPRETLELLNLFVVHKFLHRLQGVEKSIHRMKLIADVPRSGATSLHNQSGR